MPTNPVIASTGTTVAVLVTLLALLGLAMIAVAIWLVRTTRTDPVALGPLEVMGERQWRKGDADHRRTVLDTARPVGAPTSAAVVPLEVSPQPKGDASPPAVDPTPPELPAPGSTDADAEPEICESSMQESALSTHSSDDGDTEVDAARIE